MSTKCKCRSTGPGVDPGYRPIAEEEPESMTGEAGEGAKAQRHVSTMISVSTRALITMLMMSMKCTRNGERQDQANKVMMSILMWCMPDVNKDIAVIVTGILGPNAPNEEMTHSSVINAMLKVTKTPQATPLIIKVTMILEDYITQKEDCGVMALETHTHHTYKHTNNISTNNQ